MPDTTRTNERKAEILDATFRVLMDVGLPPLSFDVIARKAGLSRQVVRYYFKDTESLMIALLDQLAERYRDTLISGVIKAEGGERIKLFLDFYFDLLEGMPKPRDDQAYDALMALSVGSPLVRSTLQNQYSFLGQVLSHEFELEHPQLGSQKANELAFLFVNLMYGHWKMVASLGLHEDHKFVTRLAMDRLVDSYANDRLPMCRPVRVWAHDTET